MTSGIYFTVPVQMAQLVDASEIDSEEIGMIAPIELESYAEEGHVRRIDPAQVFYELLLTWSHLGGVERGHELEKLRPGNAFRRAAELPHQGEEAFRIRDTGVSGGPSMWRILCI